MRTAATGRFVWRYRTWCRRCARSCSRFGRKRQARMLPNQIVGIAVPPYLAQCANHRHVLIGHAVDAGHVQTVHVQWSFDGSAPDAFVCHKSFPFLVHDMLPPVRVAARGPHSLQCHRAGDQRRDVDVESGLVPAESATFADRPRGRVRHRRGPIGAGLRRAGASTCRQSACPIRGRWPGPCHWWCHHDLHAS